MSSLLTTTMNIPLIILTATSKAYQKIYEANVKNGREQVKVQMKV